MTDSGIDDGVTAAAGAPQQIPVRRVTDETERRSPIVFAIAAICFILPFVSFSCGGQRFATLSGLDLVRGAKVSVDESALEGFSDSLNESFGATPDPSDASSTDTQSEDTDPELWAIIALAAAVIGIAIGFTKNRLRTVGSLAAAAVGFLSLIVLRMVLSGEFDIPKEAQSIVAFQYRFGYWIVIVLFLLLGVAHGLTLRSPKTTLYPPAEPPELG
jgi:hypothetical protein